MKVTIITVCFNSAKFISSAIESVLSQDYKNIEYIIVDGGSSDGTVDIVRSYGNKINVFISEPDFGIYDAMNKGIRLSSGDVICILNSDDFYLNRSVISGVISEFESDGQLQLLLAGVDFVDGAVLEHPIRLYRSANFTPWQMRFGFMPPHPGSFVRRSAYETVGLYKLGYKIGADFEWLVRAICVVRLRFKKTDLIAVRMREGGVSTSGFASYWLSSKEQLRALRENNIRSNMLFVLSRLPVKFFCKLLHKGHR